MTRAFTAVLALMIWSHLAGPGVQALPRSACVSPPGLMGPAPTPWAEADVREREHLLKLLKDDDWPIRVFGLLRLERFEGAGVAALVQSAVTDSAWQVRCFALRIGARMQISFEPATVEAEMDPRVLRIALAAGLGVKAEHVDPHTRRLLRTRGIEELLLGLELAALSGDVEMKADAATRTARLIRNMDDAVAMMVARRLGRIVGVTNAPSSAREWRAWLASRGDKAVLVDKEALQRQMLSGSTPLIAEIDEETFVRLLDYLAALRRRDLDLVIVMDATASMIPMVNSARAGVDALITFMSDISRRMRLAFVAYRDHDNAPVWDGHPFSTDVTSIRKYLFDLRITGGADYPEAVLEGLTACGKLQWNEQAQREIILVGDAPPHEEDVYQVHALLASIRDSGVTVHAVHVPMTYPEGHYASRPAAEADESRRWLEEYNESTGNVFADIAEAGGGKKTELKAAADLVPSIMHFTIEEGWWSVFDEFYSLYLEVCR